MLKLSRAVGVWAAVAVAALLFGMQSADGRDQYRGYFAKAYPDLAEKAKTAKCNVCHIADKPKKMRNDYGEALAESLGAAGKNTKDEAVFTEAAKKAEEVKNAGDKTFGEILKSGELPATP